MNYLKILSTLCLALVAGQLHATTGSNFGSISLNDEAITYHFVATPNHDGWVDVRASVHDEGAAFELPAIEEWSYNSRKRELCFTVDTTDHDTYTAIAIQSLASTPDWKQLVHENQEWFCTCGGEECDCELIKFAHQEATLSFNGEEVKRLNEVVWDKDKVEDKITGEVRFEGPICKTTMILHGQTFFLVMSRYKGSDKERRPDLEAIHDRITDSIPVGCAELFQRLYQL